MLFQLSQKMPLHGVAASQRCAEKALCSRRSGRGPPNLRTVTPLSVASKACAPELASANTVTRSPFAASALTSCVT